jgi:hypothetical protein
VLKTQHSFAEDNKPLWQSYHAFISLISQLMRQNMLQQTISSRGVLCMGEFISVGRCSRQTSTSPLKYSNLHLSRGLKCISILKQNSHTSSTSLLLIRTESPVNLCRDSRSTRRVIHGEFAVFERHLVGFLCFLYLTPLSSTVLIGLKIMIKVR